MIHTPIPVTRSSMPPYEEYIREIAPLWENRWLTNSGTCHQRLERELCSYLDVPFISLFTNGHLALESTLSALELTGEVITTPFTFASTTQAIVRNGLTPIFCDISPVDLTIDVNSIERLITPRTTAIVPVHVYGNICDVERIQEVASRHQLKVVYDAAHAFGETLNGVGVGSFGDMSMFSFHATKVFHTIEGGGVVCHDAQLLEKLAALKNFGQYSSENVAETGGNAKMNEFQAAMGLCNLRHVDGEMEKRRKVAAYYRARLEGAEGLQLSPVQRNVVSNAAYFPVVIDERYFGEDRDAVCTRMGEGNVFPRKYFYPLTSQFSCYAGKFPVQETPVAAWVAERVLCLPLYADMTVEDAAYVCDLLLEGRK